MFVVIVFLGGVTILTQRYQISKTVAYFIEFPLGDDMMHMKPFLLSAETTKKIVTLPAYISTFFPVRRFVIINAFPFGIKDGVFITIEQQFRIPASAFFW